MPVQIFPPDHKFEPHIELAIAIESASAELELALEENQSAPEAYKTLVKQLIRLLQESGRIVRADNQTLATCLSVSLRSVKK